MQFDFFQISGCNVVISDVNGSLGRGTADEMEEIFGPGRVTFVHCDVTKPEHWQTLFDEAEKAFDGNQVTQINYFSI